MAAETTRKDFLRAMASSALLPLSTPLRAEKQQTPHGKLLIVVAHPDDEYACAATTYRLIRECGWVGDQVIITNGESGYRYASLAETFYGAALADTGDHARLAAIRKEEAIRAGRVLGIRRHHFLDQRDLGFAANAATASTANWNLEYVRTFLNRLIAAEQYDLVFVLLPTAETHGHHRAATLLALEAVAGLPEERRPVVLGADPRSNGASPAIFAGLDDQALTRTEDTGPVLQFDRAASFGYRNALSYEIVVNWVIAEHKTQGLFQIESGKHENEDFWLFQASGRAARERVTSLSNLLHPPTAHTATAR